MKLFVIIILSFFMIQSCNAQEEAKLPAEMPENITVYLTLGGGKTRAYKKVTIDDRILQYEELRGGWQEPQKWSAPVAREDLAKLYKIFVENRFDTIKNDKRQGIVYDAGSESIAVSLNKLESFRVTYGKNSPLSGNNLERYQAVRSALDDLIARSKNVNQPTGDAGKIIQGTWRASGTNGGYGWFLEYTFDNGNFKQTGYPAIFQEGKYRVLSAASDKITLELYEQKGTFGEENRELQISVDKKTNQLTISGTKGFTRNAEKQDD